MLINQYVTFQTHSYSVCAASQSDAELTTTSIVQINQISHNESLHCSQPPSNLHVQEI